MMDSAAQPRQRLNIEMVRRIFFATFLVRRLLNPTNMVYETLPDEIQEVDVIIAGGMYI
jgi:hypothetical protein